MDAPAQQTGHGTEQGEEPARRGRLPRRATVLRAAAAALVVLLVGALVGTVLFLRSDRALTVASHDAVVRPTLDGHAVLRTGLVLPDVRLPLDGPVGVDVVLGKTEASSTQELVDRYAFIASQPDAQVRAVQEAVRDLAVEAALRGLGVGALVVGAWYAVGRRRRHELLHAARGRRGAALAVAATLVTAALVQPWRAEPDSVAGDQAWEPLQDFVGLRVPLPDGLEGLEVRSDAVTSTEAQRLVVSMVDTYDRSRRFYADAVEAARELDLPRPAEDETVAILVSDRHLNVGMDPVARAVADAAGATAVLNAGDDTSTGEPWEAFSLDSVDEAFEDLDRWGVAGNHDEGGFVREHLADLGWTMLDGEVVEGPGGSTLLGVDDPRASGLGTWRDETGLSFAEVATRLADAACAAEERVATLLVHDANLGDPALERGCVDLVVGGHTHVTTGPTAVVGEGGRNGWTYTNGTTGGAAYAIAVGSKLRRAADVSLVTYRDGRPVRVQGVTLRTDGVFVVGEPAELTYADEAVAPVRGPGPAVRRSGRAADR